MDEVNCRKGFPHFSAGNISQNNKNSLIQTNNWGSSLLEVKTGEILYLLSTFFLYQKHFFFDKAFHFYLADKSFFSFVKQIRNKSPLKILDFFFKSNPIHNFSPIILRQNNSKTWLKLFKLFSHLFFCSKKNTIILWKKKFVFFL